MAIQMLTEAEMGAAQCSSLDRQLCNSVPVSSIMRRIRILVLRGLPGNSETIALSARSQAQKTTCFMMCPERNQEEQRCWRGCSIDCWMASVSFGMTGACDVLRATGLCAWR